MRVTYQIHVSKSRSGYYWKIRHTNGLTLCHSETYTQRNKALQTARNLFNSFKKGKAILIAGV